MSTRFFETDDLVAAARNGDLDSLKKILGKNNIDINGIDREGWSALFWSVCNGQYEAVQLLLNFGADINLSDQRGRTPFFVAAFKGYLNIVQLFLKKYDCLTNSNHFEPNFFNTRDHDDWTPLSGAAYNGHLRVVKFLVESKADINLPDKDGWTPLCWAVCNGHLQVVKFLLELGASNYYTPLGLGVGASVPSVTKTNAIPDTPLSWAKNNGHFEIIKCLEEHQEKQTILREYFNLGVWINEFEIVKLLPLQLKNQINILVQIYNSSNSDSKKSIQYNSSKSNFSESINILPLELFHELLVELWGQFSTGRECEN